MLFHKLYCVGSQRPHTDVDLDEGYDSKSDLESQTPKIQGIKTYTTVFTGLYDRIRREDAQLNT